MARMSHATRKQFAIAFDMGCGAATAYGASGFAIGVRRLDAPAMIRGKAYNYAVYGFTFQSYHRTLRGALSAVTRKFDRSQPVWRPFLKGAH